MNTRAQVVFMQAHVLYFVLLISGFAGRQPCVLVWSGVVWWFLSVDAGAAFAGAGALTVLSGGDGVCSACSERAGHDGG